MRVLIVLGMLVTQVLSFGQWLHYPTPGAPRKADGTITLDAATPRLADGKPDLLGIWHTQAINRCVPATGQFCVAEIGGSPLALDVSKGIAGGLPLRPMETR